jgi:hypothetical protein
MLVKTTIIKRAVAHERTTYKNEFGERITESKRNGVYVTSHILSDGTIIPAIILAEISIKKIQCNKKVIPVVFRCPKLQAVWESKKKVLVTNAIWRTNSNKHTVIYALDPTDDIDEHADERHIEFVFISKSLLKVSDDYVRIAKDVRIEDIEILETMPLIKLSYNSNGKSKTTITLDRGTEQYKKYSEMYLDSKSRMVVVAGHKTIFDRDGIYVASEYMTVKRT